MSIANFNQTFKDRTSLKDYDFSWLGRGYTIEVKHNVPDGSDQRESPFVGAQIHKGTESLGHEYSVAITDEVGRTISNPKGLTDERIIKAFDTLKDRFEKVAKAEMYLGTYPKDSGTPTPRPPVMRNSVGSMRP